MKNKTPSNFWQLAFKKNIIKTSLRVSIIVGIILNLINQGEYIITDNLHEINIIKVIFTFTVPYMVSTYSACKTQIDQKNEFL